ncbi:MAG: response regulator [Saprospiraceae bacterium]|nr:response regulator [Saprospiraceae bacterium]
MDKEISQIQEYLSENEIEEALKKLQSIFSLSNSELVNDTILLSGQLKKLRSDIRKGIITYEQENVRNNIIVNSALSLLDEIRENPGNFTAFIKAEKQLDQSLLSRGNILLPDNLKDILFNRIAYIKGKNITFRLLWIDDQPDQNIFESNIIRSLGASISYANSSEQALLKIQKEPFQLIISDISRNGFAREGIQFLTKLNAEQTAVPFIFYTGAIDRSKGVPPYAFGITNSPSELVHLVLDFIERIF